MYRYVHKRAKSESRREAAVTIGSHNVSVMKSIIYIRGVDYITVTEKGVETSANVSPRLCVCKFTGYGEFSHVAFRQSSSFPQRNHPACR